MIKKPLIIDTDPGIDDAASIIWTLACDRYDVKALTVTTGNAGLSNCVINALRLIEVMDRTDIPVYEGAYKPLLIPAKHASFAHGKDGMGDAGLAMPTVQKKPGYAAAEMARIVKESVDPVTILALGPMTNIALAMLLDPDFKNNVESIVFMGGAARVSGNHTPVASFNVTADPEAANIVYNSDIPIMQIGLDVCNKFSITLADIARVTQPENKISSMLSRMLAFRTREIASGSEHSWRITRPDGIGLNDLAATAYLMNPDWFQVEQYYIEVQTQGICAGMTVVDFMRHMGKESNATFAYDVDSRAVIEQWIEDIVHYH